MGKISDVLLHPVSSKVTIRNESLKIQHHAQISGVACCGGRLRPPGFVFDRAILLAGHQLQRTCHQVLSSCQQQVVAGYREGNFPLGLRVAANVEVNSAGVSRFKLRARLIERALHGLGRRKIGDVEEFQLADIVNRNGTVLSRDLGEEVHVGGQPGGSSELFACSLQTQKQPGAREDFVIVAFDPLLLLGRRIPAAEQRGEILRLEIKQRSGGNELR